ncbi:MAG: methionyl-tRNA formyltransferase [Patescibacteria group bacterium]
MRILFFGTPAFSVPFLAALHAEPTIEIAGVVTQPDKPVGRSQTLTKSPVKLFAEENNLQILQFASLKKDEVISTLSALHPDVMVVVAFGKIIPDAILSIAPHGTLNVHPSLLPKYRGPSPRQSAILNGDEKSGVSIMLLDKEMDHGPILAQKEFLLDVQETMETLETKILNIGPSLLISTLNAYVNGTLTPVPQNDADAVYCELLTREDGIVNWQMNAETIDRMFRAFHPWPGISFVWHRNGEEVTIKLLDIAISQKKLDAGKVLFEDHKLFVGTNSTAIEIKMLQPASKSVMTAKAFVNGYKDFLN